MTNDSRYILLAVSSSAWLMLVLMGCSPKLDTPEKARHSIVTSLPIPRSKIIGGFVKSGRSGDPIFIHIKPDGHYYWVEGRYDYPFHKVNGTWALKDNIILFNPQSGFGSKAKSPTWGVLYWFNENEIGLVLEEHVALYVRHNREGLIKGRTAASLYQIDEDSLRARLSIHSSPEEDSSQGKSEE